MFRLENQLDDTSLSLAKLYLDLKTGVADQECRTDLSLNFENDLG